MTAMAAAAVSRSPSPIILPPPLATLAVASPPLTTVLPSPTIATTTTNSTQQQQPSATIAMAEEAMARTAEGTSPAPVPPPVPPTLFYPGMAESLEKFKQLPQEEQKASTKGGGLSQ
jgi:hypothetical protein